MADPTPDERRQAVALMLHCIAEGIAEGVWREFKFNVRQHRTEQRHALTGRLLNAGNSKLEITFSMDVDERSFKEDVDHRKAEVRDALRIELSTGVIDISTASSDSAAKQVKEIAAQMSERDDYR